jgi:hypothetical protein
MLVLLALRVPRVRFQPILHAVSGNKKIEGRVLVEPIPFDPG